MIVPSSLRISLAQLPQPDFRRLHHLPQIPHPHRSAVLHFDHCGADIVGSLHQSHGADVQRLLATFDKSSACIGVVRGERLAPPAPATARRTPAFLDSTCT